MFDKLTTLYQSLALAGIALPVAAFAATFALNNAIAHIRTHVYESSEYARTARMVKTFQSEADPLRPLRILMRLTTSVRFLSPVVAIYVAVVPKTLPGTAIAGLALFSIWGILLAAWLCSIWLHQRHEVEVTAKKLNQNTKATKIDSGLGIS